MYMPSPNLGFLCFPSRPVVFRNAFVKRPVWDKILGGGGVKCHHRVHPVPLLPESYSLSISAHTPLWLSASVQNSRIQWVLHLVPAQTGSGLINPT